MLGRHIKIATVMAVIMGVGGCEATNLATHHKTVVGVNAAVNAEQTKGHLVVGYDRKFSAVVPKSVKEDNGEGKEVMSAFSCSNLEVNGIYLSRFTELLITGEAAKKYAEAVAKGEAEPLVLDCHKE